MMTPKQSQIREKLRSGLTVEVEPNVYGRLNAETKRLDLSDGTSLALSPEHQEDLFPRDDEHYTQISERNQLRENLSKVPGGEFFFQMHQKSGLGGLTDLAERGIRGKEESRIRQQSRRSVSDEIAQRSPFASTIASLGGMAVDLYATRGLSGAAAAPALTAAHAGTDILDQPEEVAKEAALSSALGYGIDKTFQGLSNVAQSRGARRAMRQNIAEAESQNVLNRQRLDEFNQQQAFLNTQEREAARVANEAEKQRVAALNAQGKSAASQANQQAQQAYAQQVAQMPLLQERAQQQYSANVLKAAEKVEKEMGKTAVFAPGQLDVDGFVAQAIDQGVLSGTREGKEAASFLQKVFGNVRTGSDFHRGIQTLEKSLAKATPEMKQVLSEFKEYVGTQLPEIVAQAKVFSRYAPRLEKEIVGAALRINPALMKNNAVQQEIRQAAQEFAQSLSPSQLAQMAQGGNLSQAVGEAVFQKAAERLSVVNPQRLQKLYGNDPAMLRLIQDQAASNPLSQQLMESSSLFAPQFQKFASKIENDLYMGLLDAQKRLGGVPQQLPGFAPPVAAPARPATQTFTPQAPNVQPMPAKFAPIPFTPQPVPAMPEPSGIGERLGEALENFRLSQQFESRGLLNNPVAKMAGMKYLLGPAAYPVQAAALGAPMALRGLTSPTSAGASARQAFRSGSLGLLDRRNQAGALERMGLDPQTRMENAQNAMQAVEQIKMKYPSYENGILKDPQERKMASEELENNPFLGIEDKAMLQTKINRGKPLE